eukprot:gene47171-57772_t
MSSGDQSTYLLAIRCVSLGVPPKTVFSNAGLLTNLYIRATKTPTVKNEKRLIKISQSGPFPVGGRPSSLNFEHMYTSEVFEDMPDIAPSLLATIRRSDDQDSKIRLNVYYQSNLTSGKEVLLTTTTFGERELVRAVQATGEFASQMSAEYCSGSKAYVRIVPAFAPLLSGVLPVTRAPSLPPLPPNPLAQRFVFYQEQDALTPHLDALEQAVEPQVSAVLPYLFFAALLRSLESAVRAWEQRLELERMRQGRFLSCAEAHLCGWSVLEVRVKAARVVVKKAGSQDSAAAAVASSPAQS